MMPLPKPYPPNEIDYQDWDDLSDNYAGKAATLIVDAGGKGDHSTIQEAVDALPSTSAGEVLVKGGTYTLTRAVLIENREDLVIRGVGKATELKVANKVQELIATDAASGQKNVIVADGSSLAVGQHVCVRDDSAFEVNRITSINGNTLTMEDNLASQYDVSDNGRVYTCHSAIYITGSSKRIRIHNLLVEGNRANQEFSREGYFPDEHQGDGIRLSAATESCVVEGCWIKSAAGHGICAGGVGHRFAHNECWDNEYDGVNVEPGCDRVLVLGNHCHDQNSWNGIQVGYGNNGIGTVSVIGNHCHGNRQGIAAQGGANVEIVGNVLQDNVEDGIEIWSMDRFVISGNVISGADDVSDMTGAGIHVEQVSSVGLITGNLIELCAGHGIHLQDAAYVTVTGNTIRKVTKHGVNLSGDSARDCVISGNTVIGADQGDTATYNGIAVAGDRCCITGNRLDDCDKYAIHITSASDRTLCLGNHCYQYTGVPVGAILDEGTNTTIDHNVTA
ncbi:right-handed parallel beta-helix repeat-containing protein [Candidatus Bathyarchaeota archaeon]|nr:right-handed parallel beta-helix repeat-containing protein [Candidatus Bathyarchaeota archaeon]